MKKTILLALLVIFNLSAFAVSSLSDETLCSWFQVNNPPQEYIDEAKKRNLKCVPSTVTSNSNLRVKFKIDCGSGLLLTSKGCEKIPENAFKLGDSFECELGFKKVANRCDAIILPKNTVFSLNENGWACEKGYIQTSNNCEKIQPKLPSNAFKKGDSFGCFSGYYKTQNSCITLPANAIAYINYDGYYCEDGFKRNISLNKCEKQITEDKKSELWKCNDRYTDNKEDCKKTPNNENRFEFIGWFFNSGKPTIYFWLALIFIAIALDNISSSRRKRKEKKAKQAEKYYQKLDQEKAEALAEAKRKEEEIEAKRKKDKEEAKLKAAEAKRRKEEEAKLKAAEAKRKKEEEAKLKAAEAKRRKDQEVKLKKELAASKAAELKRKKEEIKARLSEQKEKTEGAFIRAAEIKQNKEKEEVEIKEESTPDPEQKIENIADFEDLYIDRTSEEWLELIKYSFDESDAPVIMELDSIVSIDDLLFTKKRKNQKDVKSKVLKEQSLKPEARTAYVNKTQLEVESMCIKHNKYSWLVASLDGVTSDFKSIVEFDCSASSYWKARNNKISDISYAKLQHLMMVSGSNAIDYWCYWSGKQGILQRVKRNNSYIELLFKSQLEYAEILNNEFDF